MVWMMATVAPWALACGMLVSFTATAGQEPDAGASALRRSASKKLALVTDDIVPGTTVATASMIAPSGLGFSAALANARTDVFGPLDLALPAEPPPVEVGDELRVEMKILAGAYPQINRSAKGAMLGAVLVKQTGQQPANVSVTQDSLRIFRPPALLGHNTRLLPPTLLMVGSTEIPTAGEMRAIEPLTPEEITMTRRAMAPRSPGGSRSQTTGVVLLDGATPAVPRADVLASTTPAPADSVPMEIAAVPVSLQPGMPVHNVIALGASDTRPQYASLIDPGKMESEARCLAEAVYFEARGETESGQAAVAQVVLNRVKSGLYPATVCGVVYQNRHRYKACQFSFACEGRSLRITDSVSWNKAVRVAKGVTEGSMYNADVGGSTHYHANYVRPYWASRLKKMDVIGRHIFYKLKPGQT